MEVRWWLVRRVGTAGEQGQVKETLPDRREVYSINRGLKKWRRETWKDVENRHSDGNDK